MGGRFGQQAVTYPGKEKLQASIRLEMVDCESAIATSKNLEPRTAYGCLGVTSETDQGRLQNQFVEAAPILRRDDTATGYNSSLSLGNGRRGALFKNSI